MRSSIIGGTSYYYAVSTVDAGGNEGAISFTIPVSVPQGMNAATITGLSFPTTTMSFNVYRGLTPQLLYRIATVALSQASSTPTGYIFFDKGGAAQPIGPPDPNFDHANFYYRGQYTPAYLATIFNGSTIGNADMGNVLSVYANTARVVRIVSGTGIGQERTIVSNDQTSLTVSPAWSVTPDATSSFVVVDSSWKFAAVSTTSPAQFQIPYQAGTAIQISGRAANVQNQEGSADLCPMTVCYLSGGIQDSGTPSTPVFTLAAPGGGNLTVSQVGFKLPAANIATVTSGTLEVFSWDEINEPSTTFSASVAANDASISLPTGVSLSAGQIIQAGTELMIVGQQSNAATNSYSVDRVTLATAASSHSPGDPVLLLHTTSLVLPFERGFFENKASINYLHTVSMPDCRVLAAQMFMTNVFGDGQTTTSSYVNAPLRTLSGGQFSLQVSGYLATQTNAAPPLLVQATHAVRDIWASVGQGPQGYSINIDILQNGTEYCSFTIPAQNSPTGPLNPAKYIDGMSLPALQNEATLTMNVSLLVPSPPANYQGSFNPGRDLTVTIRFY